MACKMPKWHQAGEGVSVSSYCISLWRLRLSPLWFALFVWLLLLLLLFWLPHGIWSSGARDPSRSCNLQHSFSNTRSLNPLCQARNQTYILVLQRSHQSHCPTMGTPESSFWTGTSSSKTNHPTY